MCALQNLEMFQTFITLTDRTDQNPPIAVLRAARRQPGICDSIHSSTDASPSVAVPCDMTLTP